MKKILVIGSNGQIGTELVLSLRERYGKEVVFAADLSESCPAIIINGPYVQLDVLKKDALREYIISNEIKEVYLLAALLSATAEKNPEFAWQLNMEGLFSILDLAKEKYIHKIFWPSSIAVFGPTTPADKTPQYTIMDPSTVYGISKLAGERWCEYYHNKYQVDVRSLRYPGLISYKSPPGGGTTDYAIDIFHKATSGIDYDCFLGETSALPMLFMEDAIRATIELMEAPSEQIKIRSSYNLAGVSFTPKELSEAIKKQLPNFNITYNPDFRQAIADSWPNSIDDAISEQHWGWKARFDLPKIVDEMIKNIKN